MAKVAIVTGASRGLGRGIALTLAKEGGYKVYATARNKSALENLAKEVSGVSGEGVIIPSVLDQSDDAQVEKFVSAVVAEQKEIHVLVNSAYGGLIAMTPHFGKPFWERPVSVYDEALNIGARSAYVMSKFVAPIMVDNKSGLIIQTSSTGGFHYVFEVAYGVGHAAIDRLTTDMAIELEPFNVKSVTLSPVGGCVTEIVLLSDRLKGSVSVLYCNRFLLVWYWNIGCPITFLISLAAFILEAFISPVVSPFSKNSYFSANSAVKTNFPFISFSSS